jgi:AraC-like DNA-binding protein
MYLIRIGAIGGYEAFTYQLGGNPVALCQQVGISPSQFRNHNTYISLSKMALLLEKTARACGEKFFGLGLGFQQNPGVLGDLLISSSQERTIGEALAIFDNHLYLHSTGVRIRQLRKRDHAQIALSFDVTTPLGIDQLLQLGVGHLANLLARLMGVDSSSIKIALRQQQPRGSSESAQCLYPQVSFGSSFDGLVLPCVALARKPRLDEESLQRHLDRYFQQLKQSYPSDLPDQVKSTIRLLLPSNDCCIEKVAGNLDMHPRKLQRQLQRSNTSYGRLLQETRRLLAETLLLQENVSITDLAFNLGYAHGSVFSREFKLWTGRSPKQCRRDNHRLLS